VPHLHGGRPYLGLPTIQADQEGVCAEDHEIRNSIRQRGRNVARQRLDDEVELAFVLRHCRRSEDGLNHFEVVPVGGVGAQRGRSHFRVTNPSSILTESLPKEVFRRIPVLVDLDENLITTGLRKSKCVTQHGTVS
jgi:hypothetical protein